VQTAKVLMMTAAEFSQKCFKQWLVFITRST